MNTTALATPVSTNGRSASFDPYGHVEASAVERSAATVAAEAFSNEPEESNPLAVEPAKNLDLGWIDRYADVMTRLTGSPYEFNQLAGLVTAATALQRRARLRMSFGDIYPNIYACIIARSSVYHKSSAIHKPRMVLQRAMMERLFLSELMTSEGLLKQLQNQSSGVILRDEIGTLFDSNNTKYLRQLKPDLTAIYDCYPYSRALSQVEIKVEKPYLNILGATTPTRFYEGVNQTDWADGFLARWLFVLPEKEPDFDAMTGLYAEQQEAEVFRLSMKLLEVDRYQETDFVFSGDAHALWDKWQRENAKAAYYYGDDVIAAIVTRYSAYALKFAVILSAINDSWGRITPETMQTAIGLSHSYKLYAHKLLGEKDEHRISGAKLQKVFAAIKTKPGITAREIQRITHLKREHVTNCIELMMNYGDIVDEKIGKAVQYKTVRSEPTAKAWK